LIPKHNTLVAKACPAKSRIIPKECAKSKKAAGKDKDASVENLVAIDVVALWTKMPHSGGHSDGQLGQSRQVGAGIAPSGIA